MNKEQPSNSINFHGNEDEAVVPEAENEAAATDRSAKPTPDV